MTNEQLFKCIDDAADKKRKARLAEESRRFKRQKEIGAQVSKCEFLKHGNGLFAVSRCSNPLRTKEDGIHLRDCLHGDCPLIK